MEVALTCPAPPGPFRSPPHHPVRNRGEIEISDVASNRARRGVSGARCEGAPVGSAAPCTRVGTGRHEEKTTFEAGMSLKINRKVEGP